MLDQNAQKMNAAFAAQVSKAALEVVRKKVAEERGKASLNTEVYYTIGLPYAAGSAEHACFEQMLAHGKEDDPAYQDLAGRILAAVRGGLEQDGVQAFVTLNCRFDAGHEDNFLLYVLASWNNEQAG